MIILCYNYALYLPDAVGSVLAQTGVEVRVIIVDDRSTDDSWYVARRLADEDDRILVVRPERNLGPVGAFNLGLESVDAEFLVRLDADDLLTPGSLARSVSAARSYPNVGLVYGHPLHFEDGQLLPKARTRSRGCHVWSGPTWVQERCAQGINVITSAEVLMRSSIVQRVGGQQPLAHTHDMEMWLRIAAFSDVAYIKGADQAWHREHPLSLSAREVDTAVDLMERHRAFETLFSGAAGELPWARSARAAAHQALHDEILYIMQHEVDLGFGVSETFRLLEQLETVPTRGFERRKAQIRAQAMRRRTPMETITGFVRRARGKFRQFRSFRRWHRLGVF